MPFAFSSEFKLNEKIKFQKQKCFFFLLRFPIRAAFKCGMSDV